MEATCNDRSEAADLMKLFFRLTDQEQACLTDSAGRRDCTAVAAISHKLAGSCASCGMSGLAARFSELESLCKGSLPADISERIQTISREMQNIRRELETYFNCSLGAGS